jgi:DNA-binding transcriptional LysR family regulator
MRGTEFAELRAFVEVVDQGSFVRAATQLNLAPSTLSQTIRSLEERLGVRLLHRTTRSISLTEAGAHLLEQVRPVFGQLSAAVESINHFRDTPAGVLRLSVSTIPAQMILAPMMKAFMAAFPSITLDITVESGNADIVKGRFDAGIRHGRLIAQDMVMVKASAPSRLIAVAAPAYLASRPAPETPDDLRDHCCIRFRLWNQQFFAWQFEKNGQKLEVEVGGQLIVNDVDLMLKAALDGVGIGYTAEAYIRKHLATGALVPMLTDWSPNYDSWYLYYASRQYVSAPLRAFIQFLREHVQRQPAA